MICDHITMTDMWQQVMPMGQSVTVTCDIMLTLTLSSKTENKRERKIKLLSLLSSALIFLFWKLTKTNTLFQY